MDDVIKRGESWPARSASTLTRRRQLKEHVLCSPNRGNGTFISNLDDIQRMKVAWSPGQALVFKFQTGDGVDTTSTELAQYSTAETPRNNGSETELVSAALQLPCRLANK